MAHIYWKIDSYSSTVPRKSRYRRWNICHHSQHLRLGSWCCVSCAFFDKDRHLSPFFSRSSLTSNALAGQQEVTVSTVDKTQERTTFQLSRNLPAGSKAELQIAFRGEITGSLMGYYKSSYEVDGKTKHYALTQFEVGTVFHPLI